MINASVWFEYHRITHCTTWIWLLTSQKNTSIYQECWMLKVLLLLINFVVLFVVVYPSNLSSVKLFVYNIFLFDPSLYYALVLLCPVRAQKARMEARRDFEFSELILRHACNCEPHLLTERSKVNVIWTGWNFESTHFGSGSYEQQDLHWTCWQ